MKSYAFNIPEEQAEQLRKAMEPKPVTIFSLFGFPEPPEQEPQPPVENGLKGIPATITKNGETVSCNVFVIDDKGQILGNK